MCMLHVRKFICKYDSGRVFRGFACANVQDTDKISTQKKKIKGSYLLFDVNPFRIKMHSSKHLPVLCQQ